MQTARYNALTCARTLLIEIQMPMSTSEFDLVASNILENNNQPDAVSEIIKDIQDFRDVNKAILLCHYEVMKKPCLDLYNKLNRTKQAEDAVVKQFGESKPNIVSESVLSELLQFVRNSPAPVKLVNSKINTKTVIKRAIDSYNADMDQLTMPIHQSVVLATHNVAVTNCLCFVSRHNGDENVRAAVKKSIKEKFISVFKENDITTAPPTKLQKRGEKFSQSWKSRVFCFSHDGNSINYFDKDVLKGVIKLSSVTAVCSPDDLNCSLYTLEDSSSGSLGGSSRRREYDSSFEIVTPDRTYQLSAADDTTRTMWVLAVTNRCRIGVMALEDFEPTL